MFLWVNYETVTSQNTFLSVVDDISSEVVPAIVNIIMCFGTELWCYRGKLPNHMGINPH